MSHSIGIMEVFNIGLRGQKVKTDNRLGEIRKNTFGTEMKSLRIGRMMILIFNF